MLRISLVAVLASLTLAAPVSATPLFVKAEGIISAGQYGVEIGAGAHIGRTIDLSISGQHVAGSAYTMNAVFLDASLRWHFAPRLSLLITPGFGYGSAHGTTYTPAPPVPGVAPSPVFDPAHPFLPTPLPPLGPIPPPIATPWSSNGSLWRVSSGVALDVGGGVELSAQVRYQHIRTPIRESETSLVLGVSINL